MVMMENDCITISDDDEEVQVIEHFMTCEPIVIDLTESDSKRETQDQQNSDREKQNQPSFSSSQTSSPPSPPPSQPQTNGEKPTSQQFQTKSPRQHDQANNDQLHRLTRHLFEGHFNKKFHSNTEQRPFQPEDQQQPQTQKQPEFDHQLKSGQQSHSKQQPEPEHRLDPLKPAQPKQQPPFHQQSENQQQQPFSQQHSKSVSEREELLSKKELGNKHYRNNQLNDAVRLYREAGELARKLNDKELQAILHFNLAMTYSRLGSYNQAIDECAAAVKIDDKYLKAHCKRAEIYMSQGKYDEAVICYEYICEIDPAKREEAMRRIQFAREMSKRSRRLDQFEILDLPRSFTIEDMRKAYRKKARTHHPDRHSDADIVTRRIQEKIFKEASEAYAFFQKRYGFH